jgi:hypothetical protein
MNAKHGRKRHFEAAVSHHQEEGRFHRETSRHFEAGNDFSRAAHQAMMANGHALHAIDRANDALKHNAGTPQIAPPPPSFAENSPSAAQHHAMAAELHKQSALHLRSAARHFDQDRGAVTHETQLVFSLERRALSHNDEATRQQVTSSRDRDPMPDAARARRESS